MPVIARAAKLSAVSVNLAVLLLALGCSSSTRGQKMVKTFESTKGGVAESKQVVDATLAELNHLRYLGASAGVAGTESTQLNEAFTRYRSAVEKLKEQGEDAKRQAQAMKENVEANIQAWQKEMETIEDPTVKASLQSRRDAVRSNFKLVRMYADDARKAYEPFLRGNEGIVKALSLDLSPAAINALKDATDRTMADGNALQQRLSALERGLGNIEHGRAPIGDVSAAAPQ